MEEYHVVHSLRPASAMLTHASPYARSPNGVFGLCALNHVVVVKSREAGPFNLIQTPLEQNVALPLKCRIVALIHVQFTVNLVNGNPGIHAARHVGEAHKAALAKSSHRPCLVGTSVALLNERDHAINKHAQWTVQQHRGLHGPLVA